MLLTYFYHCIKLLLFTMNLKELLGSNNFGYYEKRLCFLLFLSSIPNAFTILQSLVNQYTPSYRCDVSSIVNNINKEAVPGDWSNTYAEQWDEYLLNLTIPFELNGPETTIRSSCTQYNVSLEPFQNFSKHRDLMQSKEGLPYQDIVACSEFYFEGVEVSAVTEFGLVCDQAWQRPFFISLYMMGMMIGGICGGIISDWFGRRVVFLYFTLLQFVVSFATSFVTTPVLYGIVVFLGGWTGLVNYSAATLLASEFVPPKFRSFSYFALGAGIGVGNMLLGPIMYFARNWRWFMGFMGLVGIPYVPYFWLIDESPVWLAAKGKEEELERVLQKISRINKQKKKTKEEIKQLLPSETEKALPSCFKAGLELVINSTMIGRLLIACLSW
ncbi:unnamed protein product [Clavelina lepadiformis]|uniref:Major facilitator superfamily (MFS) profile domain-containing protein n=2 Tax=Clavelina lepadiformis TaxID=159417 RepID=A0ABP0FBG2_CLALP